MKKEKGQIIKVETETKRQTEAELDGGRARRRVEEKWMTWRLHVPKFQSIQGDPLSLPVISKWKTVLIRLDNLYNYDLKLISSH